MAKDFTHDQKENQTKRRALPDHHKISDTAADDTVHPILDLQSTIGNRAVQRLITVDSKNVARGTGTNQDSHHDRNTRQASPNARAGLQLKKLVETSDDIYEQEADRNAEQVMSIPDPQLQPTFTKGRYIGSQNEIDVREHVQTKPIQTGNSSETEVSQGVQEVFRSSGQPLDLPTRNFMEPRFGHDFGEVRIHTDSNADQANRGLRANAFTYGKDIAFRQGKYNPGSNQGKALLAHELAHTIQQDGGQGKKSRIQKQDEDINNTVMIKGISSDISSIKTNQEAANYILLAVNQGFASFSYNPEITKSMYENLKNGKDVPIPDTSKSVISNKWDIGIQIAVDLVAGCIKMWEQQNKEGTKPMVGIGSFLHHKTAIAHDFNELAGHNIQDSDPEEEVKAAIFVIKSLRPGKYGLGLPPPLWESEGLGLKSPLCDDIMEAEISMKSEGVDVSSKFLDSKGHIHVQLAKSEAKKGNYGKDSSEIKDQPSKEYQLFIKALNYNVSGFDESTNPNTWLFDKNARPICLYRPERKVPDRYSWEELIGGRSVTNLQPLEVKASSMSSENEQSTSLTLAQDNTATIGYTQRIPESFFPVGETGTASDWRPSLYKVRDFLEWIDKNWKGDAVQDIKVQMQIWGSAFNSENSPGSKPNPNAIDLPDFDFAKYMENLGLILDVMGNKYPGNVKKSIQKLKNDFTTWKDIKNPEGFAKVVKETTEQVNEIIDELDKSERSESVSSTIENKKSYEDATLSKEENEISDNAQADKQEINKESFEFVAEINSSWVQGQFNKWYYDVNKEWTLDYVRIDAIYAGELMKRMKLPKLNSQHIKLYTDQGWDRRKILDNGYTTTTDILEPWMTFQRICVEDKDDPSLYKVYEKSRLDSYELLSWKISKKDYDRKNRPYPVFKKFPPWLKLYQ